MKFVFFRLLVFILPLLSLINLASIIYQDNFFYLKIIIGLVAIFLVTYFLINRRLKNRLQSVNLAFFTFLLLASGEFYFVLIENTVIKVAVAFLINCLLYFYLRDLFNRFFIHDVLSAERQRRLFVFLETPTIFFLAGGLYGLRDFLNISISLATLIFMVFSGLFIGYLLTNKEQLRLKKSYYCLIIAIIMGELFWSISALPFIYYLKSLMVALFYLLGVKLLISGWEGRFSFKTILNYLILIVIILTAALVTTKWF